MSLEENDGPFEHSLAYQDNQRDRQNSLALTLSPEHLREATLQGGLQYFTPLDAEHVRQNRERSPWADDNVSMFEHRVRFTTINNIWFECVTRRASSAFKVPPVIAGYGSEDFLKQAGGAGVSARSILETMAMNQATRGNHFVLVHPPITSGGFPLWVGVNAEHFDPLEVSENNTLDACAIFQDGATNEDGEPVGQWWTYRLDGGVLTQQKHTLETRSPTSNVASVSERVEVLGWDNSPLEFMPVVDFPHNLSLPRWQGVSIYADQADFQLRLMNQLSQVEAEIDRTMRSSRMAVIGANSTSAMKPGQRVIAIEPSDAGQSGLSVAQFNSDLPSLQLENCRRKEDDLRRQCDASYARAATGNVTATEVGLRGYEAGAHQRAVTVSNRDRLEILMEMTARMSQPMQEAKGKPRKGSVEWVGDPSASVDAEGLAMLERLALADKIKPSALIEFMVKVGRLPQVAQEISDVEP